MNDYDLTDDLLCGLLFFCYTHWEDDMASVEGELCKQLVFTVCVFIPDLPKHLDVITLLSLVADAIFL